MKCDCSQCKAYRGEASDLEIQEANMFTFACQEAQIHISSSLKRPYAKADGKCPYCRQEKECEHWTGLGWAKNKEARRR